MKNITYGSVCSGIEAASVAWEVLGWRPAWFAEIEPFPCAVLSHHWPEVVNLGDMTKIAEGIRNGTIEAPDVLVGGTPCQAFSVAGLRNGLADARGQLTLAFVELVNAIDEQRLRQGKRPVIIVWENVPGVLSSKDNAFGCFLAGIAGESCALESPGRRWTNAGYVLGPQRALAWRVLDAQFFGVAQRRRRVFVVASARTDFDPATVLFEFKSMRRNSPPCRKSQPEVTTTAGRRVDSGSHWDNPANPHPTLNQSNNIGGIGASNQEIFSQRGSGLVSGAYSDASRTLLAKENDSTAEDLETYVLAYGGGNTSGSIDVAACLTAKGQRIDFEVETFAVHGTQDPDINRELAHTLGRNHGQENALCYGFKPGQGSKAGGIGWAEEQAPTLTSAQSGTNLAPAIAFAENSRGEIRMQDGDGTITGPLSTGGGKPGQGYPAVIAFQERGRKEGRTLEINGDLSYALTAPSGGGRAHERNIADFHTMSVRRLTPRECERLQGFPDDHTLIPYGRRISPEKMDRDFAKYLMRGGKLTFAECCGRAADGPRYKAIGNSMAVPVMRWIGQRIAEAIR